MSILYRTRLFFLFACLYNCCISCKKISEIDSTTKHDSTLNAITNPIPLKVSSKLKTIVVVGSSTAAGYGASSIDSSWVNRLNSQLLNSKKARIINLGVGGFSTYNVMPTNFIPGPSRAYPAVNNNITQALSYHPDMVIINLPTNDIAYDYSDTEIMNNFKLMASLLDSSKVAYIITGTQPRNFSSLQTRKRLKTVDDELNAAFPNHVNDYLNQLSDDTWNIKPDFNSGDGVHVNNKGHKIIYQSFITFPLLLKLINL
ncbi:SGNH/GDSL hydrolase family protein [Mucilaginibacter robiniae]|uniref:SGNH/GDSL hydrolase family protein n=1 Tax=Mucilaginibacter robiniae TaxID=2728022 RepID=A0A7L5DTL1_9SPHI|nr:SGNH/GDSL hydrolase family protein [Mucilaginibacter robiniae]QJD94445.1 SGNH/GDSL hydrolase family protein [Mucilaginibacter robiniae]